MSQYAKREAINRLQDAVLALQVATAALQASPSIAGVTSSVAEMNSVDGQAASMTMATTPATGSCAVQLTLKDAEGVALAHAISGFGYASTVDGLATVAVTSFATLTNGVIDPVVVTKNFHFITKADGTLGCTLTASAGTYYLTLQLPNGKLVTSGAIVIN